MAVDETENASDTAVDNSANPVEALIERRIGNPDKALGTASKERVARHVVTQYDHSLVNTESRFAVPKTVETRRRKGFGTLCFYGPPGTEKNRFGRAHRTKAGVAVNGASSV